MFSAIKEKMQALKNGFSHLDKFIDRTRLGGLLSYRPSELDELGKLVPLHKAHFPEQWEAENREGNSVVQSKARFCLLEIDEKSKQPKASQSEISSYFVFNAPLIRGDLTLDCESLFKIVLFCIDSRLIGIGQTYEQLRNVSQITSQTFYTRKGIIL